MKEAIDNSDKTVLIFDGQGPLGTLIRKNLDSAGTKVTLYKNILALVERLKNNPSSDFLCIVFLFTNERELIDYLQIVKFRDTPVVFGPTNRQIYAKLKKNEYFKTIDLSKNKLNYIMELQNIVELYQNMS
ncbi:hypothetical protein POV27_04855 [Aureisphaera galaxeae]|uniref:hypothetical protein n=1 Tax=Aureisphaera galaxeae TaxID=1538023 RepID=UPI00234FF74E|nr:hypothetical protein [Aureisphaera galaxeae]MDC8003367.1 hypothetical protein [Aureisphaera galaxeae]